MTQEPESPLAIEAAADTVEGSLVDIWTAFLGHLPKIVAGVLVLLVVGLAAWGARGMLERALRRTRLRRSLRELFGRLAYIGLWVLGLLFAAMIGLTPTRALGGVGLASVAVGFAFKDIFENFFAGILILWRFPFDNGDFVETGEIRGKIEEITIRNTMIRRTTGELVVVPNSQLFTEPVEVLTDQDLRRVDLVCGIAYREDVPRAVEVLRDAVSACDSASGQRAVEVFPCAFGPSSIDVQLSWWTSPLPLDRRRSRAEVVSRVKGALDAAGIEIPFPQRTLTFQEPIPVAMPSTAVVDDAG